jgi:uncharacterized protein YndB with AHSA1/START domain
MSIQRDPSGRRSVRVEVEVPGTPEQVWQAIATGPGISAWFVETTVDGRKDGEVVSDFGGGMKSTAKILAYEPPFRLSAEDPGWGPGMPAVATEWTVEAKDGGTCIVRVVHSLFASTDDWDAQLEGTEQGWPSYFRVLQRYLRNFAGQPGALVQATAMSTNTIDQAWPTLAKALKGAIPQAGERLAVVIAPGVTLAGTIERVDNLGNGHNLFVHLEQPCPGTFLAGAYSCGGTMLALSAYLYGPTAGSTAAKVGPLLNRWVAEHFPPPETPSA